MAYCLELLLGVLLGTWIDHVESAWRTATAYCYCLAYCLAPAWRPAWHLETAQQQRGPRRDEERRAGQQQADVATRFDSGRHVDLLAFDTCAHTSQRESKASDGAFEVTNKEEARWQERRDDRRGEARRDDRRGEAR